MTKFFQSMPLIPDPWEFSWETDEPLPIPTRPAAPRGETDIGLRGTINALDETFPTIGETARAAPAPMPARRPGSQTVVTRALEDYIFNPMEVGLTEAGRDFKQTASAIWGKPYQRPQAPRTAELTSVEELQNNPGLAGQKMMTQAFRFAPTAIAAAAGAVATAPAAGVAGAGAGLGQLAGMTSGAMLATIGQSWGVNLDAAMQKYPNDPDKAYEEAVGATAIDTGFAGFGTLALGANPFASSLKNMVVQTFVTQPAIGVAGSRAHQAATGDDAGMSLADEYLNVTGPSVMMAAAGGALHPIPSITPERVAQPWSLPWKKNGEAFEIDPTIERAIPEDAGGAHPAEQFGAMQRVKKPVDAWHGTPHEVDQFRSGHIGTGEGGSMFGEGLYFAENRAVGESYRKAGDEGSRQVDIINGRLHDLSRQMDQYRGGESGKFSDPRGYELKAEYNDLLTKRDKIGNVYNVDLHIRPAQTLDWDAPLAEQSAKIRKLAQAHAPKPGQLPPPDVRRVLDRAMKDNLGRPEHDALVLTIDNDRGMHTFASDLMDKTLGIDEANARVDDGASVGEWLVRNYAGYIEEKGFGALTGGELLELLRDRHGASKASQMLRDAGIRGIKYLDQGSRGRGDGTRNWVMLHDEDIDIKGKFQRGAPAGRGHNGGPQDPFYYKSERLLPELAARAPAKQWDSTLRNKGVKAEELEDLGIAQFLKDAGDKPVTREEIQGLIDTNRAEFQEVNYGEDMEALGDRLRKKQIPRRLEELQDAFNNADGRDDARTNADRQRWAAEEEALKRELGELARKPEPRLPKFGEYTLPGGENYREMVLTLPHKEEGRWRIQSNGGKYEVLDGAGKVRFAHANYMDASVFMGNNEKRTPLGARYLSPHWSDDAALAHVRMSDRAGSDGARLLHLEELQSDVHNEGHSKGYKPDDVHAQIKAANKELSTARDELDKVSKESARLHRIAMDALKAANDRHPRLWHIYDRDDMSKVIWTGKPDDGAADAARAARALGASPQQVEHGRAPLPPDEGRMVRELQEAASDYQHEHFDPARSRVRAAEDEAARLTNLKKDGVWSAPFKKSWSELMLKKMLRYAAENGYDRIVWTPGAEIAKRFSLDQFLSKLQYYKDGDGWILAAIGKDGEVVNNMDGVRVADKDLESQIGKETAAKIRAGEGKRNPDHGFYDLTGADLKIEAKGKRDFYDVMIPSALKKLGAKHGAKVSTESIDAGSAKAPVHSFTITPELRAAVLTEGQPLYQRAAGAEGGAVRSRRVSKTSLTEDQRKTYAPLLRELSSTIETMAPGVKILPVKNLFVAEGQMKGKHYAGYFPESAVGPLIVLALEGPNGFNPKLAGTARHEVLHALRDAGVFKPQEWQALEDAARAQNWMAKHNIDDRYRDVDAEEGRLEEAIAEEFGAQFGDSYAAHSPLVRKAFRKLADLLRNVKMAVQKFMGADVTPLEIMKKIESGEMGWRRGDRQAQFTAGDQFQRAPNVETPEFKRWFGKSKIVDPDGQPKVLHHATDTDFDKFAVTNDIGFHFGTKEQANERADQLSTDDVPRAHILPVYLKIENPLRMPDLGTWEQLELLDAFVERGILTEASARRIEREAEKTMVYPFEREFVQKLLAAKGYDGIVYKNDGEGRRKMTLDDFDKVIVRPAGMMFEAVTDRGESIGYSKTEGDALNQARQAAREGRSISSGEDSYIVFDPAQVKSVWNSGQFDPAKRSFMLQAGDDDVRQAPQTGTEAGRLPDAAGVRGSGRVFQTPAEVGDSTPLAGLPRAIKIPGHPDIQAGPFVTARRLARDYVTSTGRPYEPVRTYAKVDPARAGRIAEAFDKMRHDPTDPLVRRAYRAMVDETLAQWKTIKRSGLHVEFIDPEKGDPYYASPRLATEDVRNNNHLWVFSTDDGFGTDGITAREMSDNPLLEFAGGEKISDRPARMNDIFRIVHDYFGHFKDGVGFRADGEENAWRSHAKMYSPEAMQAMTTETRGQNSWLNYGPYGEKNRTAKSEDTVFAEQKIGLLPEWVYSEGLDDPAGFKLQAAHPQTETPAFKKWFRGSSVVDAAGAPRVMYHWTPAKTDFDAFRRKLGDIGIHFGTKGQAEDRGAFIKSLSRREKVEGDRTIPVYLKIRQPFRVDDVGWFSFDNLASDIRSKVDRGDLPHYPWKQKLIDIEYRGRTANAQLAMLRDFLELQGYDGLVYKNTGETDNAAPYRAELERLRRVAIEAQKRRGKPADVYDEEDRAQPEYKAWMAAEDADRKHRVENAADSYVAFRPEQVKSAIGNRGTFDPKKKSIMLQRAAPTSPEFKRWFGNSQVTDHDGSPLVVYHGTNKPIDRFDPKRVGKRHMDHEEGAAFYFSGSPEVASDYAVSAWSGRKSAGANVVPVYLKMENPLIVDFQEMGAESLADDIAQAKEEGRDGVIAYNIDDGGIDNQYIVFDPKQIKSVNNRGTWSSSTPDILLQRDRGAPRGGAPRYTGTRATGDDPVEEFLRGGLW